VVLVKQYKVCQFKTKGGIIAPLLLGVFMKLNIDSTFIMGNSHQVCEDYTINNDTTMVLCDGCSSSPNTDVGARILAHAFLDWNVDSHNILGITKSFKLSQECLDATILVSTYENNLLKVKTIGDGVIYIKYKTGEYKIYDLVYPAGAPAYFNYTLNLNRLQQWQELEQKPYVKIYSYEKDGEYFSIEEDLKFIFHKDLNVENDKIEYIALMSDGIHSFSHKNENGKKDSLKFLDVLPELLSFKNFTGKFVKRRLKSFTKFCKKNNWEHYDDLSLAVMHFGENHE
jgi:hypothetical protein